MDTSEVTVSRSLSRLMEALAENTHDLWARRRMREGWTLGARRDDRRKTHPNLVSYGDLHERDKDYDRMVVCEVVKAILKLGYQIRKSDGTAAASRAGSRRKPGRGRERQAKGGARE
jgi:hypothetical protein